MISRIFAFSLLMASISSAAQSDYVVSIQGDTLFGQVTMVHSGKIDRVQIATPKGKIGYTAVQIKEVSFDGSHFHAVLLGDNIHLMKLLKGGYMSLYGYRVENEQGYSGRLLKKMDGTFVDIPLLTFRGALMNFVNDCESLPPRIKSRELGRDDLEQIVGEYNLCINKATDIKFQEAAQRASQNQKRSKVLEFLRQIETSNLENKSEVADVLNDMMTRLEAGKSIPTYQFEALKDYLKSDKDSKKQLDTLIEYLQR